jgi:hypothetical protein
MWRNKDGVITILACHNESTNHDRALGNIVINGDTALY